MYRLTMEENIGVLFKSSEQHKTSMKSRINRDHSVRIKINAILKVNSPFSNDPSLRNIIDGITATKSVNVDTFYEIGEGLVDKMQGCEIFTFEFSRKNQAKNMTTKITLDKENNIKCDPAFFFQRLLHNQIQSTWRKYYFMSYLLFLFHCLRPILLRRADKPKLVEGIVNIVKENSSTDKSEHTLLLWFIFQTKN